MNKSYYAIIPANVRYDKDLPANAKLLYGEITALCNEKGYCWASNSYFAELYGVKIETISRWISKLKNKGYIDVSLDKEKGNKRYISLGCIEAIDNKVNRYRQNNQEVLIKKSIGIDNKVNRGNPPNTDVHNDRDMKKVSNNTINNTDNNTFNSSSTTTETNAIFDKEFSELAKLYQQVIGQPNGLTADWINSILEMYGFEWCKNAFLIAEKRGKLTKSYVEGILKNWNNDGGMKLGGGQGGTDRTSNESDLGQYEDIGITI